MRARRMRLLVVAVVALGVGWLVWRGLFGPWVAACLDWLRAAGPAVFFAGMAVLPAVGFPMLPFAVAAGPAFGEVMGVPAVAGCAAAAVAANVALSYGLAHGAIRPHLARWVARRGYKWPELPPGTAWQAVFVVRLFPGLPFWVQSYLLGLAGVAFGPYLVVSTAVPSAMIVATIVGGEALWRGEVRTAAIAFGALGLAVCGIQLWRRWRRPAASLA